MLGVLIVYIYQLLFIYLDVCLVAYIKIYNFVHVMVII